MNVYIYNSNNELVGSIENNNVTKQPEKGAYLSTKGTDNDCKYAELFDDDYRIEYKATDNGTLNVQVYEMANWVDVMRVCEIHDIPVAKEKEYNQDINNVVYTDASTYTVKSDSENYPVDNIVETTDEIEEDTDPDVIPVDGITLNQENIEMTVGDSTALIAAVTPDNATDKNVTWTSSDENVATVKDGTVMAVKAGKATVTAAAGDKTAACTVTVKEKATVIPTKATLNSTSLSLGKDGTAKLGIKTLEPAGASGDGLEWKSSNENIATIDKDGNVKAVGNGTAEISLINTDGAVIATCTVTVTGYEDTSSSSSSTGGVSAPAAADSGVTMYRLYNPNSGEHFYTSDEKEKENVLKAGWKDEGVGWTAPANGDPVYRLYNVNGGEHHYTMDENEKNALIKAGWKDEGVGWYSDPGKSVSVYRQYNPNAFANNHNYTVSAEEKDHLISLGWKDENIGWYGVASD